MDALVLELFESVLEAAGISGCRCYSFDGHNSDGDLVGLEIGQPHQPVGDIPTPREIREIWVDELARDRALQKMDHVIALFDCDLGEGFEIISLLVEHPAGWIGWLYCDGGIDPVRLSHASVDGKVAWQKEGF